MSFAAGVKEELCRLPIQKKCCAVAEAYGALLYCNTFTPREIRIVTSCGAFAQRLPKLFKRAFGVSFDESPERGARGKLAFALTGRDKIAAVYSAFDVYAADALSLHINLGALESDCCRASFVRGAFLSGGSVTDPGKRYHLELCTSHRSVSRELSALLRELGFEAGETSRGAESVVYFKRSDAICDLLTTMGAPVSGMDVAAARIEKEMNNTVNRKVNCDSANADKTVEAAQAQLEAIRRVDGALGLDSLPEGLQQAALLRIANPEASLYDLSLLSAPPVTKSCLGHRLKKLTDMAKSLK